MIEATVGDLLDDKLSDILDKYLATIPGTGDPATATRLWNESQLNIYVVHDGETVLYVGQSREPDIRLDHHLGRGARSHCPSSLGRVILDNLPEARSWIVELWTVKECKAKLADETSKHQQWDKHRAERRMIQARQPCLNVVGNNQGRELPAGYRDIGARIRDPAEDYVSYGD